jgi:hypothetical protein
MVVRRLLLGCVLGLLLLLAWTAVVLMQARGELVEARDELDRLRRDPTGTQLQEGLGAAAQHLAAASSRLSSPGPAMVAELPVVGRTPEAARRTSDAVLASVRAARGLLAAASADTLLRDGRIDLDRLAAVTERAQHATDDVAPAVDRLDGLDLGLVPAPLTRAARQAQDELGGLPTQLRGAAAALQALQGALGGSGPRRLLVVLQNNAELRATGGLVSVFAEVQVTDGRLALGPFRDVEDVADPAELARQVPAPPDYETLLGPLLADTTLWKNTNADPDVPRSSEVLAAVAAATLGAAPDTVVWLDVPAMAAVLGATSPAVLPDGTTIDGDNAVEVLMHEAYTSAEDDQHAQAQRRARLRAAGDAVAQRLLTGSPDAFRLAGALRDAASGRHLAVWSRDATEQRAWRTAGLAGELDGPAADLVSFTVHNLGAGGQDGNKLDYYARQEVRTAVEVVDGQALVEREVVLRNEAPTSGLPGYVAGRPSPGTTNNFVLHALPADAEDVVLSRAGTPLDVRPQALGTAAVLPDVVTLAAGTTATWRLTYRLPLAGSEYSLRIVPQALAVPGRLEVEVLAGDETRLTAPTSSPLAGDDRRRHLSGPLDRVHDLRLQLDRPGPLRRTADALRRFWVQPVEAPW